MARLVIQSTRSPRANRKLADRGTREQLLEIAGQVFGEKGFDRATSREICERARANVAAVNYHFGGIEALYAEVVREANNRLVSVEAIAAAVAAQADARSKLQAIIALFIGALTGPASESWVIRVMGREIVSPSPLLHGLREKEILPKARILRAVVAEFMELDPDHPAVARSCISVLAPCFMLLVADRRMLKRAFPSFGLSTDNADALAAHFTNFALAGLSAAAKAVRQQSK
jgi:TetR/AcrR family transcriptional regulator, regulator of cefoperazone and chloramphenicol sensitivity